MPAATESDDELLASLEPGSFPVFYRRHVEDLVAFFMRRTRNAEVAADLAAETFGSNTADTNFRRHVDPGRRTARRAARGRRMAPESLAAARRRRPVGRSNRGDRSRLDAL